MEQRVRNNMIDRDVFERLCGAIGRENVSDRTFLIVLRRGDVIHLMPQM